MHYIVITIVPINDERKFLICKRSESEKAFPGRWTVPGGKMEVLDYVLRDKDTSHHWYNVFEETAKREVKEEVGLEINNIDYITSMVYIRSDKIPCVIVSLYAQANGEVILGKEMVDYCWVNLEEAKNYDLIEGIYEELKMLDKKLKGEGEILWKKE